MINKKGNCQSLYIFRTLRGFVIAFLLVLCGTVIAQHSESISIEVQPENSNFICYEPNQPKLTLQIKDAFSESAQATLFYSTSDISGWAQLSVLGSPIYLPDSFVVLPYMDDKWHRIYLTVKTDPNQELMRVCGSLVDQGLVYFDDIMAIPGKMPTDIPEIVSLDLVKRDMNGTWRIVKEEKQ